MTKETLATQTAEDDTAHLAVVQASATDGKITLLGKDVIKKDQDSIRRRLVTLDASIHANAVQCLLHAQQHNDTSLFRRLLVNVIDAKTGYRRQGLIAWMREFSPMELHGDVIKLTGLIEGTVVRKPFKVQEANATAFWNLAGAREQVAKAPLFRDNITGGIERLMKQYRASIENTEIVNGKVIGPKDATKPYYSGIQLDKIDTGMDQIEKVLGEMNAFADQSKDVFVARQTIKRAELSMEGAGVEKTA